MSLKKIKQLINEANLDNSLNSLNMDVFVNYYIEEISSEQGGYPESDLEYIAERISSDNRLNDEFTKETGRDVSELALGYHNFKDRKVITSSKVFKNILKERLSKELKHVITNLKREIHNGEIKIHRFINFDMESYDDYSSIDKDDEYGYVEHLAKYGGRLGIFWTSNLENSSNILDNTVGYSDDNTYRIDAVIKEEHVNWFETLFQRLHPSYGDDSESPESEIRLFKNTPIKILNIEKWLPEDGWEEKDISKIKNKIFYA